MEELVQPYSRKLVADRQRCMRRKAVMGSQKVGVVSAGDVVGASNLCSDLVASIGNSQKHGTLEADAQSC